MSILQKCVNDYLKQAESEDVLRFASDFFDSPQAMTLFEDFDLSQEEKNLAAAIALNISNLNAFEKYLGQGAEITDTSPEYFIKGIPEAKQKYTPYSLDSVSQMSVFMETKGRIFSPLPGSSIIYPLVVASGRFSHIPFGVYEIAVKRALKEESEENLMKGMGYFYENLWSKFSHIFSFSFIKELQQEFPFPFGVIDDWVFDKNEEGESSVYCYESFSVKNFLRGYQHFQEVLQIYAEDYLKVENDPLWKEKQELLGVAIGIFEDLETQKSMERFVMACVLPDDKISLNTSSPQNAEHLSDWKKLLKEGRPYLALSLLEKFLTTGVWPLANYKDPPNLSGEGNSEKIWEILTSVQASPAQSMLAASLEKMGLMPEIWNQSCSDHVLLEWFFDWEKEYALSDKKEVVQASADLRQSFSQWLENTSEENRQKVRNLYPTIEERASSPFLSALSHYDLNQSLIKKLPLLKNPGFSSRF